MEKKYEDKGNVRCQKCLQKGHWTYECKNERKYLQRPTRTKMMKKQLRIQEKKSLIEQNEIDDSINESLVNNDIENKFIEKADENLEKLSKTENENKIIEKDIKSNEKQDEEMSSSSSGSSSSSSSSSSSNSSSSSSSSDSDSSSSSSSDSDSDSESSDEVNNSD